MNKFYVVAMTEGFPKEFYQQLKELQETLAQNCEEVVSTVVLDNALIVTTFEKNKSPAELFLPTDGIKCNGDFSK